MVDPIDDDEHVAPVIPLFGAGSPARPAARSTREDRGPRAAQTGATGAEEWRSTWHDGSSAAGETPTVSVPFRDHPAPRRADADTRTSPRPLRALRRHDAGDTEEPGPEQPGPEELAARATESLVRKLRARSMSVAEATTFLRGQQLAAERIQEIIDEFCARRYLDDALLAGHLLTAGHERKGQGRVALARVLSQRGIPRDIADAALAELPDDDFERALEFARGKARSMARLDPETAKRRLYGQLQRRGYSGGIVSEAVRQALAESFSPGRSSGVRFD